MKVPVSIIIPTFNEEKYLPKLLESIKRQTTPPTEVIVCDAFSIDKTREIAKRYGAIVTTNAAWISGQRNFGAKIATQPIFLFLDADVVLPPSFLEETINEMQERDLDIASCYLTPMSHLRRDVILHEAANYYMRLTQKFYPHIPGFCIFVKQWLHKKIKGFDETLVLAEDHDYVQRAKKHGHLGYLNSYKIPVSVRRLAEEGRMKLVLKYIAVEIHLLLLGKMKKSFFNYKFGQHVK